MNSSKENKDNSLREGGATDTTETQGHLDVGTCTPTRTVCTITERVASDEETTVPIEPGPKDVKDGRRDSTPATPITWWQQAVRAYTNNYVLLALTAGFLISANAACFKILSEKASVFGLLALRASISVLVLVVMARPMGFSLIGPKSKLVLSHMRGIFGAVSLVCLAVSTSMLPLSEASFMTNSYPVVTSLLAWVFGFEQLSPLGWIGVGGCLTGNALVAQPPFIFGGQEDWGMERLVGIILGGCSNIALALTFIVILMLRRSVANLTLTFYMHVYTVIGCIPFLLRDYPQLVTVECSILEFGCYTLSIVSAIPLQMLLTRASEIGPPSKVTSILMTNMLMSAFVGMVALSESMAWSAGAGSALIFASVLVVANQRDRQHL